MIPTARDLQTMVDNAEAGILIHDAPTKNILWANPTACEMFGFTLDELRPLKAHHMSSPERRYRREVGVAWLQDAVDHGRSVVNWKYRSKDGQDFLTVATARRVEFEHGPVIMVTFRRVEQVDELQEALTRATDYMQRMMSHAAVGIVVLDDRNRIDDISSKAAELFGVTQAEVVGRPVSSLASATVLSKPDLALDDITDDDLVEITFHLPLPGGGERWLIGFVESVTHDGMQSRILVVRDITARTKLEKEAAAHEANVQRLSRLNAMGDMAMLIAHELGQPLATANNYLSGMLTRMRTGAMEPADIQYGARNAQLQLRRAADVVSSVKRYVQRNEPNAGAHDLNDILTESLYFTELRAKDAGVELEIEQADDPLPVSGEHILFGQVLINLCANAIDEMRRPENTDKRVIIRTFRRGDRVGCSISDFGRGLTGRNVFDISSQVFSEKSDGAGIGLVLNARIVERHEGELLIEPNEPRGTTMTMLLSLADSPA